MSCTSSFVDRVKFVDNWPGKGKQRRKSTQTDSLGGIKRQGRAGWFLWLSRLCCHQLITVTGKLASQRRDQFRYVGGCPKQVSTLYMSNDMYLYRTSVNVQLGQANKLTSQMCCSSYTTRWSLFCSEFTASRLQPVKPQAHSYESLTCWSLFCSSDFAASSSSTCFVASWDRVSWPFCNWTIQKQLIKEHH